MDSANGIDYHFLLELFEIGKNVDGTAFYFIDDPTEEEHYLGYSPEYSISPYWAGYCDLADGFECAAAEENRTAEAKYAHAMDNLQPLILNDSNGGGDWKEHGVSAGQVYQRQGKTKLGSETLFALTDQMIQENIRKGSLKA